MKGCRKPATKFITVRGKMTLFRLVKNYRTTTLIDITPDFNNSTLLKFLVKIMVWGCTCVTYYRVGSLAFINGNINSQKYIFNRLINY